MRSVLLQMIFTPPVLAAIRCTAPSVMPSSRVRRNSCARSVLRLSNSRLRSRASRFRAASAFFSAVLLGVFFAGLAVGAGVLMRGELLDAASSSLPLSSEKRFWLSSNSRRWRPRPGVLCLGGDQRSFQTSVADWLQNSSSSSLCGDGGIRPTR